jgi:hypothetical protein
VHAGDEVEIALDLDAVHLFDPASGRVLARSGTAAHTDDRRQP